MTAGIGDVISYLTGAAGIKPCDACKKRMEKYNEMINWSKIQNPLESCISSQRNKEKDT